jgi:EpsI family protein
MLIRTAKLLFPGILLCLVGLYRVAVPPGAGAESNLAALPKELLGMKGTDVPLEQAILDDLDPDDLLIRRYLRPDGTPVWIVLIYFVNTRLGGHDPQLCYRSQGYRTESLPDLRVASAAGAIVAESFLATRGARSERVATLWYTSGEGPVPDVGRYRRRLFLQGLRENRLYGIFIRVSTIESAIPGEAEAWNERTVAEIVRQLPGLIHE